MMIGPAPMMRMLLMSVRFGMSAGSRLSARLLLGLSELTLQPPQHQMIEALEERLQIMRARARLRMALEAECRPIVEGEALQRAVEERAVRRAHIRGQSGLIDREAVVLAGDEHAPGIEVLHRMI